MDRKRDFESTMKVSAQFQGGAARWQCREKAKSGVFGASLNRQKRRRVAEAEAGTWGELRWPKKCRGGVSNQSRISPGRVL